MIKTRHFHQRMSQRGINSSIVEILEKFGVSDGDKITLDRQNCQELSKLFAKLKKTVDKMAEKGGYTLVASGDILLTGYRVDSYNYAKSRGVHEA